jgi:hypothetical protein
MLMLAGINSRELVLCMAPQFCVRDVVLLDKITTVEVFTPQKLANAMK